MSKNASKNLFHQMFSLQKVSKFSSFMEQIKTLDIKEDVGPASFESFHGTNKFNTEITILKEGTTDDRSWGELMTKEGKTKPVWGTSIFLSLDRKGSAGIGEKKRVEFILGFIPKDEDVMAQKEISTKDIVDYNYDKNARIMELVYVEKKGGEKSKTVKFEFKDDVDNDIVDRYLRSIFQITMKKEEGKKEKYRLYKKKEPLKGFNMYGTNMAIKQTYTKSEGEGIYDKLSFDGEWEDKQIKKWLSQIYVQYTKKKVARIRRVSDALSEFSRSVRKQITEGIIKQVKKKSIEEGLLKLKENLKKHNNDIVKLFAKGAKLKKGQDVLSKEIGRKISKNIWIITNCEVYPDVKGKYHVSRPLMRLMQNRINFHFGLDFQTTSGGSLSKGKDFPVDALESVENDLLYNRSYMWDWEELKIWMQVMFLFHMPLHSKPYGKGSRSTESNVEEKILNLFHSYKERMRARKNEERKKKMEEKKKLKEEKEMLKKRNMDDSDYESDSEEDETESESEEEEEGEEDEEEIDVVEEIKKELGHKKEHSKIDLSKIDFSKISIEYRNTLNGRQKEELSKKSAMVLKINEWLRETKEFKRKNKSLIFEADKQLRETLEKLTNDDGNNSKKSEKILELQKQVQKFKTEIDEYESKREEKLKKLDKLERELEEYHEKEATYNLEEDFKFLRSPARREELRKLVKARTAALIEEEGCLEIVCKLVLSHLKDKEAALTDSVKFWGKVLDCMYLDSVRYGLVHSSLVLKNVCLHWFSDSVVTVKNLVFSDGYEDFFCVDCFSPLMINNEEDFDGLMENLAKMIVKYNSIVKYDSWKGGFSKIFGSKMKRNCQEFARDALNKIEVPMHCEEVEEYITHMKGLVQKDDEDKNVEVRSVLISPENLEVKELAEVVEDMGNEKKGWRYIPDDKEEWKDGGELVFYTHRGLDGFVENIGLEFLETHLRGFFVVLKGFDRAFWMIHQKLPDHPPVLERKHGETEEELKERQTKSNKDYDALRKKVKHGTPCPFVGN